MKTPKFFQILITGAVLMIAAAFSPTASAQDYWGYSQDDPQLDTQDTMTAPDTVAADSLAYDSTQANNDFYTVNNYYYLSCFGDWGYASPYIYYPDYYSYNAPWYYDGWHRGHEWQRRDDDHYYGDDYRGNNGNNGYYGNDNDGGQRHDDGSNDVNKARTIGMTRGTGTSNGNIVATPQQKAAQQTIVVPTQTVTHIAQSNSNANDTYNRESAPVAQQNIVRTVQAPAPQMNTAHSTPTFSAPSHSFASAPSVQVHSAPSAPAETHVSFASHESAPQSSTHGTR